MSELVSYALCSVADVKESLGIEASDTSSDNLIIRQINRATDAIENYTGRRFALTNYVDVEYDTPRSNQIVLQQRPVITVGGLSVRVGWGNSNNWNDIDTRYFFIDSAAGVLDLGFQTWGSWNRYRISYTAGYSVIPTDLQEACATLASYFCTQSNTANIDVEEKQEGQRRVRYRQRTAANTEAIFGQLGIDTTLNSYLNHPINPDK
jgi:hypothetical protein